MKGEISGRGEVGTEQTCFNSPNFCVLIVQHNGFSEVSPLPSWVPILPCADGKVLCTFHLDNYFRVFSVRNIISISFYPLSKDPHGVSAFSLLKSFRDVFLCIVLTLFHLTFPLEPSTSFHC